MRIKRIYEVTLKDEEAVRAAFDGDIPGSLIDACSRCADIGNVAGSLYLLEDDTGQFWDPDEANWVDTLTIAGPFEYTVEEVATEFD